MLSVTNDESVPAVKGGEIKHNRGDSELGGVLVSAGSNPSRGRIAGCDLLQVNPNSVLYLQHQSS